MPQEKGLISDIYRIQVPPKISGNPFPTPWNGESQSQACSANLRFNSDQFWDSKFQFLKMAYTTWPEYFVIFANVYGAREFSLAGAGAEFWERKINHFTSSFLSWKCTSLLKTNSEIRFPRFPKKLKYFDTTIFNLLLGWNLTSQYCCWWWIPNLFFQKSGLGLNFALFKFICLLAQMSEINWTHSSALIRLQAGIFGKV